MANLFQIIADNKDLQAMLADDSTDIPADQLQALFEAGDDGVNLKAARVIAFIKQTQADANALDAVAKGYAARAKTLNNRAEGLREYLRSCLALAGTDKLGTTEHSAKLTAPRASVVIDDADLLPAELTRTKVEPDKTAIKAAIESGAEVKGAHIEMKAGLKIL